MSLELNAIKEYMQMIQYDEDFKHLDDEQVRAFAIELKKIEAIKQAGQGVSNAVRHKELY